MTLPWPPSVNTYWRLHTRGKFAGRVLISREGRQFRLNVERLAQAERWPTFPAGRLVLQAHAYPPDRRARDLDNILKGLLDALSHAGVVSDDEQFDELHVFRMASVKPGKVDVFIHEV